MDELDVEQAFRFIKLIKKRKISEYKINLAISQNPHTKKPEELYKILDQEYIDEPAVPEFDAAGFEALKQQMTSAANSRFVVKS